MQKRQNNKYPKKLEIKIRKEIGELLNTQVESQVAHLLFPPSLLELTNLQSRVRADKQIPANNVV